MDQAAEPTPKKIVIVEDNASLADIYKTRLELLGYTCFIGYNGITGLYFIQKERPDLVLLDLMVPDIAGDEILRRMRASVWGKDIPVFVISNLNEADAPKGLRELGIVGYAVKANLQNDQLDQAVNAVFAGSSLPTFAAAAFPPAQEPSTVPVSPPPAGAVPVAAPPSAAQAGQFGASQKIVIVEDNVALADIYKIRLELLGYACFVAHDGEKALEVIQRERPNLVLLDLMIPKLAGDQVLARMRTADWGRKIPVFIISNLNEADAPQGLRAFDIAGYAVKANLTNDQLDQLVDNILKPAGQKEAVDALEQPTGPEELPAEPEAGNTPQSSV